MDAVTQLFERFDPVDGHSPGVARRAAVAFARRRVSDDELLDAVALCVSEAVTNVVVHAYRHQTAPGDAIVEAAFTDRFLCIRVCDHGAGMAPRVDSPGLGLGLPLIAQLADEAQFQTRKQGGTEVSMLFAVR